MGYVHVRLKVLSTCHLLFKPHFRIGKISVFAVGFAVDAEKQTMLQASEMNHVDFKLEQSGITKASFFTKCNITLSSPRSFE